MCGIAGIIDRYNVDSGDDLKKILKQIKYRGPDETGIVSFQNVSIGMNRLAIIDSKKHIQRKSLRNSPRSVTNDNVF